MLHNYPRVLTRFQKEFGLETPQTDSLDLMRSMLRLDPRERISAEAALKHPYVKQFHMANVERTASRAVSVPIDDNDKKSTHVYRDKLYAEITRMKAVAGRTGQPSERSHVSSNAYRRSSAEAY